MGARRDFCRLGGGAETVHEWFTTFSCGFQIWGIYFPHQQLREPLSGPAADPREKAILSNIPLRPTARPGGVPKRQTNDPAVCKRGVFIDLFIQDPLEAERGVGFQNRRPAQRVEKALSFRVAEISTGGASPVSPSWVISALRAALRRSRSETRLRAQSRVNPSPARGVRHPQRGGAANGCPTLPSRRIYHFIDSLAPLCLAHETC